MFLWCENAQCNLQHCTNASQHVTLHHCNCNIAFMQVGMGHCITAIRWQSWILRRLYTCAKVGRVLWVRRNKKICRGVFLNKCRPTSSLIQNLFNWTHGTFVNETSWKFSNKVLCFQMHTSSWHQIWSWLQIALLEHSKLLKCGLCFCDKNSSTSTLPMILKRAAWGSFLWFAKEHMIGTLKRRTVQLCAFCLAQPTNLMIHQCLKHLVVIHTFASPRKNDHSRLQWVGAPVQTQKINSHRKHATNSLVQRH